MKKLFLGLILGLMLVGCSNMTSREKSALVGAGVGALGGAAVDNYNKKGNVLGN